MVRSRLPLLQSQGRRRCPLHPPPRRRPIRVAPHHVRECAGSSLSAQPCGQPRQASELTPNWEAANGNKEESKTQGQGKAQENNRHQGGQAHKDQDGQKNQQGQKKAGEESSDAVNITRESQAAQESQAADTARSSQTEDEPARGSRPAGGPYRRCDRLLKPPVTRDPTARGRYVARWRCDPHSRAHHRFQPEGRVPRG